MNKGYQISNDGTIFSIKDDGSISRLAKINDQGRITDLEGRVMSSTPPVTISTSSDSNGKGWYWFFIVVFALVAIVLGVLYSEADQNYYWANQERWEYKNKYENASSTISSLRDENNTLKQERNNAKKELSDLKSKVSGIYPLIITDIEIANVYDDGDIQTDYGYMIYSYNTMYLKPRIKYIGIDTGYKTLKVKLYRPDGSLSTGSYYTYSYSDDVYVYEGSNNYAKLSGWGNASKGNWSKGTYRIEIWYENTCLKAKTFTIY